MNSAMNVVLLHGRLSRPAARRVLPSGEDQAELEVSVQRQGERTETVNVVWPKAPASASTLDIGAEVVVVGRVRRRFFQAGGRTASRTEVVADTVIAARHTKRVHAAIEAAFLVVEEATAMTA